MLNSGAVANIPEKHVGTVIRRVWLRLPLCVLFPLLIFYIHQSYLCSWGRLKPILADKGWGQGTLWTGCQSGLAYRDAHTLIFTHYGQFLGCEMKPENIQYPYRNQTQDLLVERQGCLKQHHCAVLIFPCIIKYMSYILQPVFWWALFVRDLIT